MAAREKALILCGGLQSSGTTLISYCFLQRGDTDGVLDADNDLLPALDPALPATIRLVQDDDQLFPTERGRPALSGRGLGRTNAARAARLAVSLGFAAEKVVRAKRYHG